MNKVIVVTGASSGVGLEVVNRFGSLGWNVVGLARNSKKLSKIGIEFNHRFLGIETDVRDENSVDRAFDIVSDKYKKVDLFVNNAAIFKNNEFISSTYDEINSIIDTNLKGAMFSTLRIIKIMKSSGYGGRIINIGSVASTHGISNQAVYCASKYGLNGFAEALNQEIMKHNISISTIFSGGIDTPLWNESNPYPGGDTSELLKSSDIVSIIEYISRLQSRIILKNITLFPSNEWH